MGGVWIGLKNGKHLIVQVFKDLVSVKFEGATHLTFGNSTGLMGEFKSGSWLSRTGDIISDANKFGNEWQVRDNEPVLFQTVRAPQYPQACKLPDPTKKTSRRLGQKSISEDDAKKACASAGAENLEGLHPRCYRHG